MDSMTLDVFFADSPLGLAVFCRVEELVSPVASDITVHVSKSQVAFRRRRGFAFLWRPGQYLRNPAADVVLSIALSRRIESGRWKEVAHPTARVWMHHLEIHAPDNVDHEVEGWLLEAAADAAAVRTAHERTSHRNRTTR